jgi:hypothetical protein
MSHHQPIYVDLDFHNNLDFDHKNNFVDDIIKNQIFIKVQCFIKYCDLKDVDDQIILRDIKTLIKSYSDFFPIESIGFSVSRITHSQLFDYIEKCGTKRNAKYLELFLFFKILCDGEFTPENNNLIEPIIDEN